MAVTKTHPIKSTLKAAIDYILNPEKTDGKLLASSFGCGLETADIEFAWTREAAGDRGTHLGRHLIQSFAVGETTPEEAHKIGMELAGAVLGGKYEFVLTTHVDKDHLHNHLIFNAVSFVDYKKYHSNKQSYEQRQLPPLNDLNQLYPASDFLKQKIHKIDSDEKRRQKLFMLKKAGKRITASIACLLAVFTCIFAPVEAVQDAVISTVIEWRDKFNQIIFSSDSELHSLPATIHIKYWPSGYYVESTYQDNSRFHMAAVNKDGLYSTVEILLMDEPQTVLLDNEYSDYYRISFGSNDALWTCHESGNNILTWADQNVLYQVTTAASLNEAIYIAENIEMG